MGCKANCVPLGDTKLLLQSYRYRTDGGVTWFLVFVPGQTSAGFDPGTLRHCSNKQNTDTTDMFSLLLLI